MRSIVHKLRIIVAVGFAAACNDTAQPVAPLFDHTSGPGSGQVCETIGFDGFDHGDEVASIATGFGFNIDFTATPPPGDNRSADRVVVYSTDYISSPLSQGPDFDLEWQGPNAQCPDCEGLGGTLVIPDKFTFASPVEMAEGDSQDGGTISLTGFAGNGNFFINSFTAVDQESTEASTRLLVDGVDIGGSSGLGNGSVESVTPLPMTFTSLAEFVIGASGGVDNIEICRGEDCQPCKGGLLELQLLNNGPDGVIQVSGHIDFEGGGSEQFVAHGEVFTLVGTGKNGKMKKNIRVDGTKIQTKCSKKKPIAPGMVFGVFQVVGAVSKDGGIVCPLTPPGSVEDCEAGKPAVLTMLYTGEACSASDNGQDPDKAQCTDFGPLPSQVVIRAGNKTDVGDSKERVWFDGVVDLNTTFEIDASNADKTKLDSNTWVHIFALDGTTLLQKIQIHTSCSQPLNVGDQFGSLIVDTFVPELK